MKREYLITVLFFLVAALFFYLFYRLMVPFFTPIAWAAILVIVFYPVYERLQKRIQSSNLTSILMCILVFVIIIGPSIYVLASLVEEASNAVTQLNEFYKEGKLKNILELNIPFFNAIKEKLKDYPQLADFDTETAIKDALSTFTKFIISQASVAITNIGLTLFYFFLMLFSMFFFFRDGDKIIEFLRRITPLRSEQVGILYSHLHGVIQAMMYGGVVIALLQGLLGGLLFFFAGIPSPVMWGTAMAILAFIPVVGPFLIYIPAGIILFFTGSPIKGIIVIGIGILISQTDNFLRPILFTGRSQTHTLMLFFSIMGGIAMFGLLGVVLGPFIAAVFLTLLKMFELQLHPEETSTTIISPTGTGEANE